jgi:hypothetical protein
MNKSILSCLLASCFCLATWAQQYSIDWYKVASGGGTSTGGTFSISGTIGQHDTGVNVNVNGSVPSIVASPIFIVYGDASITDGLVGPRIIGVSTPFLLKSVS